MEIRRNGDAPPLVTPLTFVVTLALVAAFVGLLVLEGRPGWGKYGLGFWSAAWTPSTSQNLFDPYSLSHVLHGIIVFWMLQPLAEKVALRWRFVAATVIEIGWELVENSPWVIERYRQATASLDYTGDSILNSTGDLLSTMIGFYIAWRVSAKAALLIFVSFELWMLYVARDNLTLNVLMLFFPLEAIKEWQMAGF